jgi:hypothetical protein
MARDRFEYDEALNDKQFLRWCKKKNITRENLKMNMLEEEVEPLWDAYLDDLLSEDNE